MALLVAILMVFGLTNCKKDSEPLNMNVTELQDVDMCLTKDSDASHDLNSDLPPLPGATEDRASGHKNKFWTPGQTLRVKFIGGTTFLKNKVQTYIQQWSNNANIHFQIVTAGNSEIRVAFDVNNGNWSYVGKDNLNIAQSAKTMNLAIDNNSSETTIRRKVLHEFGHAIGLEHEHQQPYASIPWNKPAVYQYYANSDGWSQAEVDANILNKKDPKLTNNTSYDPTSIMHYPVSAALTTNGFSIPWNTELSTLDKDFMKKKYSTLKVKMRNAVTDYSPIYVAVNGITYPINSGETFDLYVTQVGANKLYLYEKTGANWNWDIGQNIYYGTRYKIVKDGASGTNFKIQVD